MCLFNWRRDISTCTAHTFFVRSFWNSKLRNICGTSTRMQNMAKMGQPGGDEGGMGEQPGMSLYYQGYPFLYSSVCVPVAPHILLRLMRVQNASFWLRKFLLGFLIMKSNIWGLKPPQKREFWGLSRRFKPNLQNF